MIYKTPKSQKQSGILMLICRVSHMTGLRKLEVWFSARFTVAMLYLSCLEASCLATVSLSIWLVWLSPAPVFCA